MSKNEERMLCMQYKSPLTVRQVTGDGLNVLFFQGQCCDLQVKRQNTPVCLHEASSRHRRPLLSLSTTAHCRARPSGLWPFQYSRFHFTHFILTNCNLRIPFSFGVNPYDPARGMTKGVHDWIAANKSHCYEAQRWDAHNVRKSKQSALLRLADPEQGPSETPATGDTGEAGARGSPRRKACPCVCFVLQF